MDNLGYKGDADSKKQTKSNNNKKKSGGVTQGERSHQKMAHCTLIEPNAMPKSAQTFQHLIGVTKPIQVTEMLEESKSKLESRYE